MLILYQKKYQKYQNPGAYPCYLASLNETNNLPKELQGYFGLLLRIRYKALGKGELGPACKLITDLASYESKNSGFDWETEKVSIIFKEKSNTYYIEKFITSCPKSKLREIIRENEKMFSEKYGVRIKFILNGNLPNEASSFLLLRNSNLFQNRLNPPHSRAGGFFFFDFEFAKL